MSNASPGLYNRQATYFIQKANEFKSSIWIEVEDRKINAKSLLGVLSMGITKGTRVSILAEGPDEEEAVKALTEMLVKEILLRHRRMLAPVRFAHSFAGSTVGKTRNSELRFAFRLLTG